MPNVGAPELIILLIVLLLVFGPKRLPEMGRSVGRGIREFKDSVSGNELLDEPKAAQPSAPAAPPPAPAVPAETPAPAVTPEAPAPGAKAESTASQSDTERVAS